MIILLFQALLLFLEDGNEDFSQLFLVHFILRLSLYLIESNSEVQLYFILEQDDQLIFEPFFIAICFNYH